MNQLFNLAKKYSKPNSSILEIGCGNGKLLTDLAVAIPTAKFTAIDVSDSGNLPKQVTFFKQNVENLPVEGKYDLIIMDNVLEHIKNPLGLLERLKINLSKNGAILLAIPNRDGWNNEARVYLPHHGKHYFLYDQESIQYMLARIGYTIRVHNLYGEQNKPLYAQIFARMFNIQNPMLTVVAFSDVNPEA